jgi:arylsulfatase A-like enzyme
MKLNRLFLLLVALTTALSTRADLAALFTNVTRAAAVPRRPSIIVIQCHDLARGDLSCYGQTNFLTPNLDHLAAEGVRFTGYTGGDNNQSTLAQLLRKNGYCTGLIGEWGLPGKPWELGFDEFAGFLEDAAARDYYANFLWRFPHVIRDESNRVVKVTAEHEMIYTNADGKKGTYLPELLVTAMDNFIRIHQPDAANHYRPYFLVVNFPAPRSAVAGKDEFPVPTDAPFTGEAWSPAAKNRAALITRLDAGIGRLFEQLKENQQTNNIAIFFTSSSAPEKFTDQKLNSFLPPEDFRGTNNPTPRLPMLVRFPAKIPAGQVSDKIWTAAELAPTALEIAYVKPATNFTGTSILPEVSRKPAKP